LKQKGLKLSSFRAVLDLPWAQDEQDLVLIHLLELQPGFWWRAGKLRANLTRGGYRPKLADTLIAQTCLDHKVGLLTRDRDFGAFARWAGLKLL